MKKTNNYIYGINPKALEKYLKKNMKYQTNYITNENGNIYYINGVFGFIIPECLFNDVLQKAVMTSCPSNGETIKASGDYNWQKVSDHPDYNGLFVSDYKALPVVRKTRVSVQVDSEHVLQMFCSENGKFTSAIDKELVDIFDMTLRCYQNGPLSIVNMGYQDTDNRIIVCPCRFKDKTTADIVNVANSENIRTDYDSSLQSEIEIKDRELKEAQEEIERLKKKLEEQQTAKQKPQEAQEKAEEGKTDAVLMEAPKAPRKATQAPRERSNEVVTVSEKEALADSERKDAENPVEVPDGKQNASMTEVIGSLENLFDKMNGKFFSGQLVKPVITVQQDTTKGAYGWCTSWKAWRDNDGGGYYEINICAETLNRPLEKVAGTLLHEMVHLYNIMQKVKDNSRGGTYHNTKFRDAAQDHGLTVEKGEKYGWFKTELSEESLDWLRGTDFEGFTLCRPAVKKKPTVSKSSSRKYVCPCCGAIVRATKEVRIICADCNEEMILESL